MADHEYAQDGVAIVGLGLIGGSIAKDLHAHHPDMPLYAIDPNDHAVETAVDEGIIDEGISYADLGACARLVILAPPIDKVEETAYRVHDALRKPHQRLFERYVVTDTASIKAPIARLFEELATPEADFVASHPMAGTEFAGFAHARKDLFRAKPWIICPHPANQATSLDTVGALIRDLGGKLRTIDARTHDEQAGLVSHAVIMLSNVIFDFVATRHPEALELAGDGFTSTTRLASGNPELHSSIVAHNADVAYGHLEEFVEFLQARIAQRNEKDTESLLAYFTANMEQRNKWLHRRK